MELESRIALVTGGTAGIGLESARLLAGEGADVVLAGRDAERGARATLPLHHTAQAAEIAEAVLFLASPRASYVTGSTLYVDGGGSAV